MMLEGSNNALHLVRQLHQCKKSLTYYIYADALFFPAKDGGRGVVCSSSSCGSRSQLSLHSSICLHQDVLTTGRAYTWITPM